MCNINNIVRLIDIIQTRFTHGKFKFTIFIVNYLRPQQNCLFPNPIGPLSFKSDPEPYVIT